MWSGPGTRSSSVDGARLNISWVASAPKLGLHGPRVCVCKFVSVFLFLTIFQCFQYSICVKGLGCFIVCLDISSFYLSPIALTASLSLFPGLSWPFFMVFQFFSDYLWPISCWLSVRYGRCWYRAYPQLLNSVAYIHKPLSKVCQDFGGYSIPFQSLSLTCIRFVLWGDAIFRFTRHSILKSISISLLPESIRFEDQWTGPKSHPNMSRQVLLWELSSCCWDPSAAWERIVSLWWQTHFWRQNQIERRAVLLKQTGFLLSLSLCFILIGQCW